MGEYQLVCAKCGQFLSAYAIGCPEHDALLRTRYKTKRLNALPFPGMWKFLDWLPVSAILSEVSSGPVTFKSEGLAKELGLRDLFISFNGYWPERDAHMLTCSFKELEALPSLQRLKERGNEDVLVVASAGNTGRAFAYVSSLVRRPTAILVPSTCLDRVWLPNIEPGPVVLVAVEGDYCDAIILSDQIASLPGFVPEGGARNVGRRDGMGTVMLDAVRVMGSMPRHYYQAVGSGTGGIAAYEASVRLLSDGRFGNALPILHLAQNLPCAPLFTAHHGGLYPPTCPKNIFDDVLFNRRPPYAVPGGVRDALEETKGEVVGVFNEEASEAKKLFERVEGIDILPAAAIAVAALIAATDSGAIRPDEKCLLNITGGGLERMRKENGTMQMRRDEVVPSDQKPGELADKIREIVRGRT